MIHLIFFLSFHIPRNAQYLIFALISFFVLIIEFAFRTVFVNKIISKLAYPVRPFLVANKLDSFCLPCGKKKKRGEKERIGGGGRKGEREKRS